MTPIDFVYPTKAETPEPHAAAINALKDSADLAKACVVEAESSLSSDRQEEVKALDDAPNWTPLERLWFSVSQVEILAAALEPGLLAEAELSDIVVQLTGLMTTAVSSIDQDAYTRYCAAANRNGLSILHRRWCSSERHSPTDS